MHNLNLLLSLLLSPSSLKISAIATPWVVSYSLRPLSCAAAFPTGYGPRGTPTTLDHGNASLLCDIVVRCFRSQVAVLGYACTTNQLHPSKVGFCLILTVLDANPYLERFGTPVLAGALRRGKCKVGIVTRCILCPGWHHLSRALLVAPSTVPP